MAFPIKIAQFFPVLKQHYPLQGYVYLTSINTGRAVRHVHPRLALLSADRGVMIFFILVQESAACVHPRSR